MLTELAEMKRLGVSQMELTNKFDNAFTGVAGDSGSIGPLTNSANFLSTGSFLRMRTCPSTNPPGVEDRLQSPNLGDLGSPPQGTPPLERHSRTPSSARSGSSSATPASSRLRSTRPARTATSSG